MICSISFSTGCVSSFFKYCTCNISLLVFVLLPGFLLRQLLAPQIYAIFKGANNGHIDYLVMNSYTRYVYLQLWRVAGELPEYIDDPMSGKRCLAHDGIPILVNDYILDFNPDAPAEFTYLSDEENPEFFTSAAYRQSSIYAVVLGEEREGIFGIYPESFGNSPLKVDQSTPSQSQDTILLRGMIQAGIVPKTRTSVGRLAGIRTAAAS